MPPIHSLLRTLEFFQKAVPEPTRKNLNVQLGCHCEEVVEMLERVSPQTPATTGLLMNAMTAMGQLADHLKTVPNAVVVREDNRVLYLDALCDQIVTAVGCAHMSQFDIVGAVGEVNRSNLSKFDEDGNPIFDENGKIAKGPNYAPADLLGFA